MLERLARARGGYGLMIELHRASGNFQGALAVHTVDLAEHVAGQSLLVVAKYQEALAMAHSFFAFSRARPEMGPTTNVQQ